MKRQIVNIVNFVRDLEPRPGVDVDLVEPVKQQLRLLHEHNLKATFLLQYDALLDPRFTSLFEGLDDRIELGIWLEIVQPLVEKVGLPWHGRYPWDWHAHCGFSVGYPPEARERFVDAAAEKFREVFHREPKSWGSWALDAHTAAYLNNKYSVDALCICRDQWGTDGYSFVGGYYSQGYYPSRSNLLCPAQTRGKQIGVPVFRMLGSDPIYQYGLGVGPEGEQPVATLEPVSHKFGGGNDAWVDWYFHENFSGNCLSFGYAQAGQENSFGWPEMSHGLTYQFKTIKQWQDEGKLQAETLGETGRWFKNRYPETPASVVAALSDPRNEGRRSVWYDCKNYRANVFTEKNRFWIRDLYLFREDYRERYLSDVCPGDGLLFDNLPGMDGNLWSGKGVRAGIYPFCETADGLQELTFDELVYREENGDAVLEFTGTPCGKVTVVFRENGLAVHSGTEAGRLVLQPRFNPAWEGLPTVARADETSVFLKHNGFEYRAAMLEAGTFADNFAVKADDGGNIRARLDAAL